MSKKIYSWTVNCENYRPHTVAHIEDAKTVNVFSDGADLERIRKEINAASETGKVAVKVYPATNDKFVVEFTIEQTQA